MYVITSDLSLGIVMRCHSTTVGFDPSDALCEGLPRLPDGAFAALAEPVQDPRAASPPGHPSRKGRGKGSPGYPRKHRNAKSAVRNLSTRLCVADQMKLMATLTTRNESVFHFVRRAVLAMAKAEGIELSSTATVYTPRRPASQLRSLKG